VATAPTCFPPEDAENQSRKPIRMGYSSKRHALARTRHRRLGSIIRATSDAGHEVGLHAWDHHAWQAHIDEMEDDVISETLGRGIEILTGILGCPPSCSAAPGWKCNDKVLLAKSQFHFKYNSDCRGESIFRPIVGGREIPQPQIPVTLPTYDEVVGRNSVTHGTYNDYMLTLLNRQKLNVLTIHAEVEGIACLDMFGQFVKKALTKGASFVPLGVLLREYPETGSSAIVAKEIPGREGWVCCQSNSSSGLPTSDRALERH